jgi:SAM-dependent methyltransferase
MMIDTHSSTTSSLKQEGAAFWDANPCGGDWPSYAAFLDWIRVTEPYAYDVLDRWDWAGKEVLEVGCGQGTTLNDLPRRGATVTGIDMSLGSIRRSRAGAEELGQEGSVRLARADAERLPFSDASFDIALSIGVLHHTPDTAQGVREIFRVLRPGGAAIVMLYRSGNPKWWTTRTLRAISSMADVVARRRRSLARRIRRQQSEGAPQGTALLELFGVPTLKAFSNAQAREMFAQFDHVRITNHQPGFKRMADILPIRQIAPALTWLDTRTREMWGFYQVIEARKPL